MSDDRYRRRRDPDFTLNLTIPGIPAKTSMVTALPHEKTQTYNETRNDTRREIHGRTRSNKTDTTNMMLMTATVTTVMTLHEATKAIIPKPTTIMSHNHLTITALPRHIAMMIADVMTTGSTRRTKIPNVK